MAGKQNTSDQNNEGESNCASSTAGNRLDWKLVGTYPNREEANAEDPYSTMWNMKDRRAQKEMVVERYHCKNKKFEGCPAQKRINIMRNDGSYRVEVIFEHISICPQKMEEIDDFKSEIISLYNSGCTRPWDIKRRIREGGKDPNMDKIYQVIHRHRKRLLNDEDITLRKVTELCEEINRVRAEKDCGDSKAYTADLVLKRGETKVLITAKNSLILLSKAQNVHIDSTYRVVDLGYPVIVFGVTDANQSFVLIAIAIVSDEKMETYLWVLDVLRRECEMCGITFKPKNLIADLAGQITLALEQFEPGCLRTHCWFHVSKGMRILTKGLLPCFRGDIRSDIAFLQLLNSRTLFKKGWALFFDKWRQMRPTEECVTQLNKNYYLTNQNWYEGYAVHSPSTNNALEKFNSTVKSRYVNWARMSILEFIRLGVEAVEDYAFPSEKVPFERHYNETAICQDDYSKSMIFKQIGSMEGHINYLFVGKSEAEREMCELLGRKLENLDFTTFNEFKDLLSNAAIVSVKDDGIQSLADIFCSCWHFVKKKKCKHVYTFLNRCGKSELLNSELILAKNKRGRPKRIKKNMSLVKE